MRVWRPCYALRFMDSFDHYDLADITRKWTSASTAVCAIDATGGRNGNGYRNTVGAANTLVRSLDSQATWITGFALYIDTFPNSTPAVFLRLLDAGTTQVDLRLSQTGGITITRNGTALAVTGSANLSIGIWYYIEFKCTIADSIGANTCVLRVNGQTAITVNTGQDTKNTANASADSVSIGCVVTSGNTIANRIDDVYMLDGTGGVNDDFLGDVRVEARMPNANGNVNQFLGSDADSTDNYLHVDETSPDDDTTYVEDSTPGNQDLYGFQNLSVAPAAIYGVQTNVMAKKDDAGARSVMQLIRSGGITYDGGVAALSQGSYEVHRFVDEVDPDTAAAWTESGFNAAEFGIETV